MSPRRSEKSVVRRSGRSVVLYDRSHNKHKVEVTDDEEDLSQAEDFPPGGRSGTMVCVEQSHLSKAEDFPPGGSSGTLVCVEQPQRMAEEEVKVKEEADNEMEEDVEERVEVEGQALERSSSLL